LGKAKEVVGVDLDDLPLAWARQSAALNGARVRFIKADVFPWMRDAIRSGRTYDAVVLDPPKLIRSRAEIDEGTRKHFDLNRLALQLVTPGGILLSCTCSGLLSPDRFLDLIRSAARQPIADGGARVDMEDGSLGRQVQILKRTGAAADHPVDAFCKETEYLHAVWLRVG
jgi:23S rRNA (cytosine1962-C5)-methyltransferase